MAVIRGLLAILVGAIVTLVLGALYEYLKPPFIPNPEEWKFVYPWFTGVSGLVGALVAVLMYGSWQASATAGRTQPRPAREPRVKAKPKKRAAGEGTDVAVKTSGEVPGMPTFDLESGKGGAKEAEKDK